MTFVQGLFGPPNVEKMKAKRDVKGLIKALGYKQDSTELEDTAVHERAAEALGKIGDASAVEPLIATLKDGNVGERWTAAEALGKLGDARAIEPLIATLHHDNDRMRSSATEALGKLVDTRAVEPLIAALKDDDWRVRTTATILLGKIGDAHAMEPLITALRDSELTVSRAAVNALDLLGWRPGTDENGARYWSLKDEWDKCIEIGTQAVEPLIARLKHGAWRAIEVLGKIGDARAVEPLIAVLKDVNWAWRKAAVVALGKIGDARTVEALIAALKDDIWEVREAAAESLGKSGDARAVEPLVAALHDHDDNVRNAATKALGLIGDTRAIGPLTAGLKDGNLAMHEAQVEALGMIGDASAIAPLIALLKIPSAESSAAEVLEKMGAPAVEPLCTALKEDAMASPQHPPKRPFPGAYVEGENLYWERVRVRETIAGILGDIADSRAIETLTWVSTNDPHVVNMLENEEIAARDDRWPVREAAKDALEKIANNSKMKS